MLNSVNEIPGVAKYLIQDGLITQESLQPILSTSLQEKCSLVSYLVRNNILSSQEILNCCVKYFALPVFDLINFNPNAAHDDLINIELMLRHRVILLYRDKHALHVGISDPTNHSAISALSFQTGLSIRPMLVCEARLAHLLSSLARSNRIESALSKITPIEDKASKYDTTDDDDGPLSEFVNGLIDDAVEQHVSDIHIEPFTENCRIRFRRDGLLYEVATIPPHFATRIITRLKIMSHLNIAERRLPQDGRIQIQQLDIRINSCPTLFGEKIVLRILDASKIKLNIDDLGLTDLQKKLFLSKLIQPQGLILVTGPTGSGKTITLYSALHFLNHIERNISSVEDPVEIELSGINQININPRIGLDFSTVLRSLLRQDPDIIMIGEIRDTQTATIAMQAAQTGHLVLSTLHTNSAIETITRLQSMGIAAYHFISSVSLIVAQRLVRKICSYCKQAGCEHCHQGYQGRIGIFEVIPLTEKIKSLILAGENSQALLDAVKQEQWMLLWDAGMEHVKNGITSYAELLRVAGNGETPCYQN